MTEEMRLERALKLATEKHAGQYRKGGAPYITHPVAVARTVKGWGMDTDHQIAALFHDLLEDTDATREEIAAIGGEQVLKTVCLLTKEEGYCMAEYVAAIWADPMARVVKAADRLHNLMCADQADEAFRRNYIRETREWYMDFCPEILEAVARLALSLETAENEGKNG